MDNNVKKIDNIKYQVQQLIQYNLHREVTPETKHNISGIYMIYIDNFTSEKIVPIYIGQAKNIQKRYKQHFEEVLALNRLSYDEYNKYFFSKTKSFYEGKFKGCKIFKYMIDNKGTLHDFRMIVLEEVEEEYLDKKEQDYFQRLLPSFFGFNQLNSFLKQIKMRFSKSQMINSEMDDYLSVLTEDIKGVYSYYDYGFTRFNIEHSMPKNISYLLKEKELLDSDILLRFEEVKLSHYELSKRYLPNFEEMNKLVEKIIKLSEVYNIARNECDEALDLLEREISEKFKELKIYNEDAIKNFINSIKYKGHPKHKEHFLKYLKSQKCKLNFYNNFDEQIKDVNKKLKERDNVDEPLQEVIDLYQKRDDEMRPARYKMIFPSCQFESFSLGDRSNNLTIDMDEDYDLLNTCHFKIYISNNGNSRSDIRKYSYIIRLDYCYIDNEGNKLENRHYIDNETTKNCQSGIEYFEKDYYDIWAMKAEKFKISSLIDNEQDNSFISVQAEFKHGINDYTVKDKQLVKLSFVLDEIQQMIDDDTRFNPYASESDNCLKMCMILEGTQNNPLVEQLLTKKLPKIKKKRNLPIKKVSKKIVNDKTNLNEGTKITRSEAYRQKVLKRSDNTILVLNYVSSREKVTAQCTNCEYKWEIRSDHLLTRPYCQQCREMTKGNL